MVNFVTSSYKPELLEPLVEKIANIPEVVCKISFNFRKLLLFFCFLIIVIYVTRLAWWTMWILQWGIHRSGNRSIHYMENRLLLRCLEVFLFRYLPTLSSKQTPSRCISSLFLSFDFFYIFFNICKIIFRQMFSMG